MDCLECIKLIDDNSVDLVITSPPYDKMRDYNLDPKILSGEKLINTILLPEIKRILKPTGSAVFVIDDQVVKGERTLTVHKLVVSAVENAGLHYHDMYIYLKDYIPGDASRRSRNSFEYMPMFKKDIKKYKYYADRVKIPAAGSAEGRTRRMKDGTLITLMNYQYGHATKDPGNALYFKAGSSMHENKIAFQHPATFPLAIPEHFINLLTDKNDVVLDPFVGSGTTAIACKKLDRNFIGCDINKEYINIANQRLNELVV